MVLREAELYCNHKSKPPEYNAPLKKTLFPQNYLLAVIYSTVKKKRRLEP